MQKEVTQSINLNDPLLLGNLLGPNDENLRFIQDSFQARITVRGSQIEIEGSPIEVDSITTLISDMLADIDQGVEPDVESIKRSPDPAGSAAGDQKRIATPERAIRDGADHIVVGRPVWQAENPRAAAQAILASLP